jgi:hypothetical protein
MGTQSNENIGLKIVTRQTLGFAGVSERTLHLLPDRRRLEMRSSIPRTDAEVASGTTNDLSEVWIVRCDLGR